MRWVHGAADDDDDDDDADVVKVRRTIPPRAPLDMLNPLKM